MDVKNRPSSGATAPGAATNNSRSSFIDSINTECAHVTCLRMAAVAILRCNFIHHTKTTPSSYSMDIDARDKRHELRVGWKYVFIAPKIGSLERKRLHGLKHSENLFLPRPIMSLDFIFVFEKHVPSNDQIIYCHNK